MLLTPEKWKKKHWQEKQMLVIVDNHIEWEKNKQIKCPLLKCLENINFGSKTIVIILLHALNFIRMIYIYGTLKINICLGCI